MAAGAFVACVVGVLAFLLPAGGSACPAVGYLSHLTVSLDAGWADRDRLKISVACAGPGAAACRVSGTPAGPVWQGDVWAPTPSMQATVAGGGSTVSVQTFAPVFTVIDHPAGPRCGGPSSAEVTLPPPS